tara:strand:+ start:226 stop:606 length:381 start_codon:yes stop_codon:yes gene_type:complete
VLSRYLNPEFGPLILRLSLGLTMLLAHGVPKLVNFTTNSTSFPDPLGVSPKLSLLLTIFAEVVCSIFLILGLKVRITLIPLIFTMLVASFIVHAGQAWSNQEPAFIFLTGYIAIMFTGPGKFSLTK